MIYCLTFVVFPLSVAHVTGFHELFVHSKSTGELMLRLAVLGDLQVVTQHLAILRSNAVVDNLLCTLARTLAAKVCHSDFRYDHFDGVLAVVEVGYHRHDRRDSAVLSGRSGSEDGEICVAGEIAAAADTVHHLRAAYMRRVDVSVDIYLQRGVDSDQTKSADHFRVVGSLLRTEQHLIVVEIQIRQHFCHLALNQTKRAAGSELAVTGFDQIHYGVLYYFGVHLKRRNMRVLAQFAEYGVRYIAHTALDRKEGRRNASGFHLSLKEHRYVLADLGGCGIYRRESGYLVRPVGLHDSSYLGGINLDMVRSAAVGGFVDRYLAAHRRVERFIQVVHTAHGSREHLVQLHYDLVRHAADGWHDTHTGCRNDRAVLAYIRSLDDSELGTREKTVTQVLCHMAQVHIEIMRALGVDLLAHGFVGLVRCTELHCVSACQCTVATVAHRRTRLQTYTERNTLGMQTLCTLGQCKRNRLRHSGGGKTTHA